MTSDEFKQRPKWRESRIIVVRRNIARATRKLDDGLRCRGLAAPENVAMEPRMGFNMNSPKCKLGVRDEQ